MPPCGRDRHYKDLSATEHIIHIFKIDINLSNKGEKYSNPFIFVGYLLSGGLSRWCLLQENDGRDMPLYCQRNHKHKISRTPLYPYGSGPMM